MSKSNAKTRPCALEHPAHKKQRPINHLAGENAEVGGEKIQKCHSDCHPDLFSGDTRQLMHARTHGAHTGRRGAMAISFLQTSAIFSLFLSPSQPLRRCGDKISIPFPPLLPSTAEQEVKTKGTEGEEERGEETERKMLTKEDIGRKELGRPRWRQRNTALRV